MCNVSIIIPTLCDRERGSLLLRAISSCLNQRDVLVEIIIVVNGDKVCSKLYKQLKGDIRLKVFYLEGGNVSIARYYGVQKSSYDYFCFLDDDDELIKNTLAERVNILDENNNISILVSNGYFVRGKNKILIVDEIFYQRIISSLIFSFLEKNWFASPSGLYCKSRFPVSVLDIEYSNFEFTYLFFKLVETGVKIEFDRHPAYYCYADTDNSASKSESYMLDYPNILKEMLKMDLDKDVIYRLKKKYIISLNVLSLYFLNKNKFKESWFYYIKCVLSGGWGYVFYARKIINHFLSQLYRSIK